MQQNKKKISGGVKFFLAMLVVWAVIAVFDWDFFMQIAGNFGEMLRRVIPIMILVYVVMFLMNVFVRPEHIQKHLGRESGFKGWAYSVLSGILIPSPPYIIFPLLGDFQKQGMKNSLIVSFLYNRNLQITFLPVMAFYFGVSFTIVVSVYIFLFAILSGILLERIIDKMV